MPRELPIACSLSAAEMPARLAEMAAIGQSALVGSEAGGRSAVLRFQPTAATRERLDAVVAAEAECCAFLKMDLRDSGDEVELRITAPEGAQPVLDGIVAAFRR